MSVIKIKKESLSTRCEICHKSDYFEPNKNRCLRCEDLIVTRSDKGSFKVNWRVDLALLTNTLRNFAWQNLDSELIKACRRVIAITFITSILLFFLDRQIAANIDQYYIPPLPDSQTEDFTMWGCGGYQNSIEDIIVIMGFIYAIGAAIALLAYFCPNQTQPLSLRYSQTRSNSSRKPINPIVRFLK